MGAAVASWPAITSPHSSRSGSQTLRRRWHLFSKGLARGCHAAGFHGGTGLQTTESQSPSIGWTSSSASRCNSGRTRLSTRPPFLWAMASPRPNTSGTIIRASTCAEGGGALRNEPQPDDPKFFTGRALTYYGRWTYKYEEAARRGAIATIIIHAADGQLQRMGRGAFVLGAYEDQQVQLAPGARDLALAGWVTTRAGEKIAASLGKTVEEPLQSSRHSRVRAMDLRCASRNAPAKIREIETRGSSGVEGSDPQLRSEAVVFGAHWDHLGINDPVAGRSHLSRKPSTTHSQLRQPLLELARPGPRAAPGETAPLGHFYSRDVGRSRAARLAFLRRTSSRSPRPEDRAGDQLRRLQPWAAHATWY